MDKPYFQLVKHIEITPGNINNNHIYLRNVMDMFPNNVVGGSDNLSCASRMVSIDFGGNNPLNTDIDGTKKIYRKRGWIREFFNANCIQAGDQVMIERLSDYEYRVRKLNHGCL